MRFITQISRSSKLQMGLALTLLSVVALISFPTVSTAWVLLLGAISAVLLDFILTRLRSLPHFLLSAAFVTGLIVALIFQPEAPWWQILLVVVLAIGSKNFLKIGSRHIFNPASFGLFLGALLFGTSVTWWGVSWYQGPFLLLLLILALVSMYLMGRYKITLSFLLVYLVMISLITNHLSLLTILDPTVLFFGLVMLPEPMTSPHSSRNQLLFGAFVAIIVGLISYFGGAISQFQIDPLILALLVGNLTFFKLR